MSKFDVNIKKMIEFSKPIKKELSIELRQTESDRETIYLCFNHGGHRSIGTTFKFEDIDEIIEALIDFRDVVNKANVGK